MKAGADIDIGLDELHVGGITLRGVTRGGIQTCLMCPELKVMFDVGGVAPGQLRYSTVLVTHGHQDHLGGLPYLVSQRHLLRLPALDVHLPQEAAGPMRTIFDAWAEIEGFELEVNLMPRAPGDVVELGPTRRARCYRSVHRVPSLAWVVHRVTQRLKPEFEGRLGPELRELKTRGVEIAEPHETPVLAVTGDTRIELWNEHPELRRTNVLVFEVTSWDERSDVAKTRQWGHTHVDEMVEVAGEFEGEALVLVHRSPRHTKAQAERIVAERFPAHIRERTHVFGN